jgi:hypothetical protein
MTNEMKNLRYILWAGAVSLAFVVGSTTTAAEQKAEKNVRDQDANRPKITLRAQPSVGVSPSRVVLTAELRGGANDFEEYYCPTVEWEWGDETRSESSSDCEPYEAGKSEIKRRFTVQHVFRLAGEYQVFFRLKRHTREVTSASTYVRVQPGAGDLSR